MRRTIATAILALTLTGVLAAPALACGGLVAPNGSVNLVRTATLAAYHNGIEHYVTSFEFAGGGAKFGSIVPLPGIPTKVTRGGEWTLQRLQQEVTPVVADALAFGAADQAAPAGARVILETEIDGLKITVLEGGAVSVGTWAEENGFNLPPDAPEVLDFYARRSPIFMAVRFDPKDADVDKLSVGDGIPIHLRIPTTNPWVPLRILGLGNEPADLVEADVFLLTDREPAMLPKPVAPGKSGGLVLDRSEEAGDLLMSDLRSDKGMKWMPKDGMWLSYLRVDSKARDLTYDLAIDASGYERPSPMAAGFVLPALPPIDSETTSQVATIVAWLLLPLAAVAVVSVLNRMVARIR
jgi:uncharacterized protein DUF2330